MNDTIDFGTLFSTLSPLRRETWMTGDGSSREPVFRLYTISGQPYVELTKKTSELSQLSAAEDRLLKEIMRISRGDHPYVFDLDLPCVVKASLWEHPYLLHMMKELGDAVASYYGALKFSNLTAFPVLKLETAKGSDEIEPQLCIRNDEGEMSDITFLTDDAVLCGDTVYPVRSIGANYPNLQALITPINRDILESYLSLFLTYFDNITPELNGVIAKKSGTKELAVPTLFLEKVATDKALYLRAASSVESIAGSIPPELQLTRVVRTGSHDSVTIHDVVGCDIQEKVDNLENLIRTSAPDRNARKDIYRDGNFFIVPPETAGPFLLKNLHKVLDEFRLVGSDKLKEYKVVAAMPKLSLRLLSGIDFLEGDADVEIGEEKFTIGDLLSQYAKKKYIQLGDGNRGILDEAYIQRLQRLFRRRDKDGRIKVNLFDLPEVEELIQSKLTGAFANKSRQVLEGFNTLKGAETPKYKVKAELRPYQNEGVKWMKYLFDNKLGGCLADDMGLGKTLQTIALLSMVYPRCKKPSMIVMPRSLLFNWEKELVRFAPKIKFHTYYGPDRDLEKALEAQVILSTYGIVRNDIMTLRNHEFKIVVLDESQNIKNHSSQTTMAVMMLEAEHRFALSGTPIENNLTELYSLFRFLNPTMFGSLDDFNSSYTVPIQKYGDKDATDSLRRKIFPFILRRLKKEVLDDLPPRIDLTRFVEMSEKQKKLYEERRLRYKQEIGEAIARDGVQKSQFMLLQAFSELRRIASVPEAVAGHKMESPKIDQLMESLQEAVSNGHKSVVFFNFLAGLETVMDRLEKLGIGFETMTGSTQASARKTVVERFQADPDCMILLMTLKVGGVGLNLTAADTVFLFEPWWNRAAEEQAINRLHRIGQKSTVSSFSLITVGTIEEKILQLQEQKSELFNQLISSDGSSSKQLSEKDIEFILS